MYIQKAVFKIFDILEYCPKPFVPDIYEEKLELPSLKINDKIANWLDAKEAKVKLKKDENNKTIIKTFVDIRL